MFKIGILLLFVLSFQCINAQVTLNYNFGEDLIDSGMSSCERDEGWSRVFTLSDFGISPYEQFVIKSGEVAFSKSDGGANLQFIVYSIDETFPEFFYSLYPITVLGSHYIGQAPVVNGVPEIIQVDFEQPIIVPAGVERILVTVRKIDEPYSPDSSEMLIAGTEEDTGASWYEGCDENYGLSPTTDLTNPVPNANFYINVTGEVFDPKSLGPTTRLSHNICDDLIETDIHSCTSSYLYWARAFTLEEFGISTDEEFVINSGQVGINKTGYGAEISFNIYEIDDNFPASFSETDLIGSSQYQNLQPNIFRSSQIAEVFFDTPIVIPAGVKRILVEVHKGVLGNSSGVAFIAGSAQDNDVSWQRGCSPIGHLEEYTSTANFGYPNANFYINVTGKVKHRTNNFQMIHSNFCSEFLKEFGIEDASNVASIAWDFGDPASGADNTSTDLSPFHEFSEDGTYTITATVKGKDGNVEVITETIDAKEPPIAYGVNNLEACENNFGTGTYSGFDTSGIGSRVLGNQTNKVVTYIDGSGNTYDVLPNPFTNTLRDRETITVRVAREEELCCYAETTFDLIVNPLPDLSGIEDLFLCENDDDGFTAFDLTPIQADLSANNIRIDFFFQDGEQIPGSGLGAVTNKIMNQETITVKATNLVTGCYNETGFKIGVTPPPIANTIGDLTGCDDNNDGISEYFDTSTIESQVLGNQTGMEVSYHTEAGEILPGPLPNPYTNTKADEETITVRVTNPQTGCYAETFLNLITSSQPSINQPATLYACDTGNGIASFNTATIENQLIGSQTGLLIFYYDENGNELTNFVGSGFTNSVPYEQQIMARIEDPNNASCAIEVTFSLKTISPPEIELEDSYEICSLGESLELKANPSYSSWTWFGPEGNIISEEPSVTITSEGIYGLSILEEKNGVICENYKEFELVHSEAPVIEDILFSNFSDDSSIEVLASGDGVFEYSIDGTNFQISNIFPKVSGGTYNVTVRDINGCGELSQTINLLNYPRFFTPNNDGYHDRWQIKGLSHNNNVLVSIYDRYGKLLKHLSTISDGWDGTFNGRNMPSDDYWFRLNLEDGTNFSGHFSLVR